MSTATRSRDDAGYLQAGLWQAGRRRRLGCARRAVLAAVRRGAGGREGRGRGRGAGGATVAHYIKKDAPELDVTLIEANPIYSSSFFSNLYLGGLRTLESLNHAYGGLGRIGVKVVHDTATDVDTIQEDGQNQGRAQLRLRPARALARHRHQVRQHQGLFARGVPHHAARLHDRGAGQAPAQAAAAGHARRRHGGDRCRPTIPIAVRPALTSAPA